MISRKIKKKSIVWKKEMTLEQKGQHAIQPSCNTVYHSLVILKTWAVNKNATCHLIKDQWSPGSAKSYSMMKLFLDRLSTIERSNISQSINFFSFLSKKGFILKSIAQYVLLYMKAKNANRFLVSIICFYVRTYMFILTVILIISYYIF